MTLMLMSILAAAASAAAQAEPPQVAAGAAAADKKICRMIVPTGSIMGKRFCLTKQEWTEMNTQTSESASAALSKRGTGMCDGKCPNSL